MYEKEPGIASEIYKNIDTDPRSRSNWHLTEIGGTWSVGASEEEPGYYPPDHNSICDCIVAPGEYIESHPEVRRSGLVDAAIREAIKDWWDGKDLEELEEQHHAWLVDSVYEISQEELDQYDKFDALGEIAYSLFQTVFKTVSSGHREPYRVVDRWKELRSVLDQSDLSKVQHNSLLQILEKIRDDTHALESFYQQGFTPSLARRTGARSSAESGEVTSLHLPGALGFVVDTEAYERIYPNKQALGFTIRVFRENDLLGKMFVVNGTDESERTIRHEYAHVLFENYFRLQEERINQEYSTGFSDPEAQEMFTQMKDELIAYSAGGEYIFREDALLRGVGVSFMSRIKHIRNSKDAELLVNGWEEVKEELNECQSSGIPAESLFSIFISSNDFDVMRKRLFLLRERKMKNVKT